MIVTRAPCPDSRLAAERPAKPAPMTITRNTVCWGTLRWNTPSSFIALCLPSIQAVSSLGENRTQSAGDVVHLREDGLLQSRLVCHRGVDGAYPDYWSVKAPEAVLRGPRRDLSTEPGGEGVFVHD